MNKIKRLVGVNGIHSQGEYGIDKLLKGVAYHHVTGNIECVDFTYPTRWAIELYRLSTVLDDAQLLYDSTRDGDNIVAHSYGTVIVMECIRMGRKFDNLWFFGSACSSDSDRYYKIKHGAVQKLTNIINRNDIALKFGSWLPFHIFGKLGRLGYRGVPDHRIKDIDDTVTVGRSFLNHSTHLRDFEYRKKWINAIANDLRF